MNIKRYLLTIILLGSILANSPLFAQNAINVHISPDKESVLIASLLQPKNFAPDPLPVDMELLVAY